jgi:hypothetical protein
LSLSLYDGFGDMTVLEAFTLFLTEFESLKKDSFELIKTQNQHQNLNLMKFIAKLINSSTFSPLQGRTGTENRVNRSKNPGNNFSHHHGNSKLKFIAIFMIYAINVISIN